MQVVGLPAGGASEPKVGRPGCWVEGTRVPPSLGVERLSARWSRRGSLAFSRGQWELSAKSRGPDYDQGWLGLPRSSLPDGLAVPPAPQHTRPCTGQRRKEA